MSSLIEVNDQNFEKEVLQSERPVFVEFSADWCGPCVRQLPIMEKFAADNPDRVKVCKMDVDDSPKTTSRFGIRGVPAILLFNHGEKVDMKVGITAPAILNNLLLEKVGV